MIELCYFFGCCSNCLLKFSLRTKRLQAISEREVEFIEISIQIENLLLERPEIEELVNEGNLLVFALRYFDDLVLAQEQNWERLCWVQDFASERVTVSWVPNSPDREFATRFIRYDNLDRSVVF